MKNLVAALILLFIIGCAIYYIVKQKKKGVKCIGCPHSGCCNSKSSCTCDDKSE